MTVVKRIPLTVIGGFLGAGKTTLLNRMLRDAGGKRFAVLLNDFGELNIDAELVASNTGDTIALTNGCVCCSIGDDLSSALINVLESRTPFDAVVIEASGVSDPWRIAQVGLAAPELSLEAVIVMVDAAAILAQARNPLLTDSLERQLKAADLIVLNKTDLVDDKERSRVREWISSVVGLLPVFETSDAAVPLALLSGLALPGSAKEPCAKSGCSDADHDHSQAHGHQHSDMFETWSSRPASVFSAAALRIALKNMPAGILRLKGIVGTAEHGWSEIQFSGRHGSLRKALAAPTGGSAVVAIGLQQQLPRAALDAMFASPA